MDDSTTTRTSELSDPGPPETDVAGDAATSSTEGTPEEPREADRMGAAQTERFPPDPDADPTAEWIAEVEAAEVAPSGATTGPRLTAGWVRLIRGVGWTSLTLGLLILGFVAHQLWVTSWFAERHQVDLAAEREARFAEVEVTTVPFLPGSGPARPGTTTTTGFDVPSLLVEAPPREGEAFALLRIPKIEALAEGWNVVEGVSTADLKSGAGHMPDTALPGQPGNAVISGHRTTYGAPFHDLDILEPGDRIHVTTAVGTHTYAVRELLIVEPTDVWVTDPRDGAWLTLTTCHPKFSARQRLIVFAEMLAGPNAAVIRGEV